MRKLFLTVILVLALPVAASAQAIDPATGETITADEYTEIFSVDNLVAEGVLSNVVDNGDGTVTGLMADPLWGTLVSVTLQANPLDRPVAATPSQEPNAPTVREVLFPEYPATATRLAALTG